MDGSRRPAASQDGIGHARGSSNDCGAKLSGTRRIRGDGIASSAHSACLSAPLVTNALASAADSVIEAPGDEVDRPHLGGAFANKPHSRETPCEFLVRDGHGFRGPGHAPPISRPRGAPPCPGGAVPRSSPHVSPPAAHVSACERFSRWGRSAPRGAALDLLVRRLDHVGGLFVLGASLGEGAEARALVDVGLHPSNQPGGFDAPAIDSGQGGGTCGRGEASSASPSAPRSTLPGLTPRGMIAGAVLNAGDNGNLTGYRCAGAGITEGRRKRIPTT